jgi:hypothetical protein
MVAMCHVMWISALVIRGPPDGFGGSIPGESLLTRISPPETGVKRVARLINAGRKEGSIPRGPPARAVALALLGALEGAVIALAGQAPHDERLAAGAVAGVLGLDGPGARRQSLSARGR